MWLHDSHPKELWARQRAGTKPKPIPTAAPVSVGSLGQIAQRWGKVDAVEDPPLNRDLSWFARDSPQPVLGLFVRPPARTLLLGPLERDATLKRVKQPADGLGGRVISARHLRSKRAQIGTIRATLCVDGAWCTDAGS